jgi:hypothetical protein
MTAKKTRMTTVTATRSEDGASPLTGWRSESMSEMAISQQLTFHRELFDWMGQCWRCYMAEKGEPARGESEPAVALK